MHWPRYANNPHYFFILFINDNVWLSLLLVIVIISIAIPVIISLLFDLLGRHSALHHQIFYIILTILAAIVIFVTSNREIVVINIFISFILAAICTSFLLLTLLVFLLAFVLILLLLLLLFLLGLSLLPCLVHNAREAPACEWCPRLLIVCKILILWLVVRHLVILLLSRDWRTFLGQLSDRLARHDRVTRSRTLSGHFFTFFACSFIALLGKRYLALL